MTAPALSAQFLAAVLSVLKSHVGRANAIGRRKLCAALAVMGFGEPSRAGGVLRVDERKVREAITWHRLHGELIGSTGGVRGGYWMIESMAEGQEFLSREVRPRAMIQHRIDKAMSRAMALKWGVQQMGLEI